MRALTIAHAVSERVLSQSTDSACTAVMRDGPDMTTALLAHLDGLEAELEPSLTESLALARDFGAELLGNTHTAMSLVGVRYGLLLGQDYSAVHVPTPEAAARLLALPRTSVEEGEFARGLERCMTWFERLDASLDSYADRAHAFHVAGLNPEAGHHAMPQDPRDITLALRAGREAWNRHPYLAERFGARGARFTSSDSCWLLTLTERPPEVTTHQLNWLRGVLSTRGIPTIILETHLRALAAALQAEFPAETSAAHALRSTRYDAFLAHREEERARYGSALPRAIATCESALAASESGTQAAALVASAWVDEQAGIVGAFDATRQWFADPQRSSLHARAAVDALVDALVALRDESDRLGAPRC